MNYRRISTIFGILKGLTRPYHSLLFAICAIAVFGYTIKNNYGITADEPLHITNLIWNKNHIATGNEIPGDLKTYGLAFDAMSEGAFQLVKYVQLGKFIALTGPTDARYRSANLSRIKFKHGFTFAFSLLAMFAVGIAVGQLIDPSRAWLGVVALALFPLYWGHSFFNLKDIPFASMFTCATVTGALFLRSIRTAKRTQRNNCVAWAIAFGASCGLATGIRIGGVVLPFFVLVAYILTTSRHHLLSRKSLIPLSCFLISLAVFVGITVLSYPYYWTAPHRLLGEVIGYQSQHSWPGNVLLQGELISGRQLPWYYIPHWLFVSTPIPLIAYVILGFVFLGLRHKTFSADQKALVLLCMLQLFALPVIAILKHSTLYNGIRHILFVFPMLAMVVAYGLSSLYDYVKARQGKLCVCVAVAISFLPQLIKEVRLHPVESIYFNDFVGGLSQAHKKYDTDYWGLSLITISDYLNHHAKPASRVIAAAPIEALTVSDRRLLKFMSYYEIASTKATIAKPFYYIVLNDRGDVPLIDPGICRVVREVIREGTILSVLQYCPQDSNHPTSHTF